MSQFAVSTSWHSYPSIYNVGHRAVMELLRASDLLVEEKVDGSQFSFGRFGDELRIRSKGQVMQIDAPEKMFSLAAQTVLALATELRDGWTYRAEYLMKPKHNTLRYERCPERHLIVFDISPAEESYLSWDDKASEAARLGLAVVPLLHRGTVTAEVLTAILDRESCLGGAQIEGVVIKPARYDVFGLDKKVLMAKHVSERFKEVHKTEWRKSNPTRGDVIVGVTEALRTDARWEKAVQHLRERGQITDTPKDIGALLKEVQADLDREMREEVAHRLIGHFWPEIRRGATRGLPEWYKTRLLQEAFTGSNAQ
jgi:hypothetical protein